MRALAISILLVLSTGAFAQTACPQGVPAGSPLCGPSPAQRNAPAPPPEPVIRWVPAGRWHSKWGAIAMDRKIGRVGAAADMATEELAKSEAMKQCGKLSSAVCAVDVAYTNGCVAIGWPSEGGIVVDNVDSDIQKAKSGALQKCADTNGAACEITYAECSKPVFEPFQY